MKRAAAAYQLKSHPILNTVIETIGELDKFSMEEVS